MFISDNINLRVKDALPRRSGEGRPLSERGFDASPSWIAIFFVDVDVVDVVVDANDLIEWRGRCKGRLNAETNAGEQLR